jgi:hypothetical protein
LVEEPEEQDEEVVKSLGIENESSIIEEEEEHNQIATSVSSASSIVPPSTPPSISTFNMNEKLSSQPPSPRATSLLRRETTKLNDRRKSLTKKFKRVLVRNNSKRLSV